MKRLGSSLLFGRPIYVEEWNQALRKEEVVSVWATVSDPTVTNRPLTSLGLGEGVLPLAVLRAEGAAPCHAETRWQTGDRVCLLAYKEIAEEARQAIEG